MIKSKKTNKEENQYKRHKLDLTTTTEACPFHSCYADTIKIRVIQNGRRELHIHFIENNVAHNIVLYGFTKREINKFINDPIEIIK